MANYYRSELSFFFQDDEENSSGYQTVMRLLENGEKISHMYRCARVQGLDTAEGLLLFGREHFYILDGFTLVNNNNYFFELFTRLDFGFSTDVVCYVNYPDLNESAWVSWEST